MKAFDRMTDLLEDLTALVRAETSRMEAAQAEITRTHDEVWRNRELMNRTIDLSGKAARAAQAVADKLEVEQVDVDKRTRAAERHEESSKAAHEEHREWERDREKPDGA